MGERGEFVFGCVLVVCWLILLWLKMCVCAWNVLRSVFSEEHVKRAVSTISVGYT